MTDKYRVTVERFGTGEDDEYEALVQLEAPLSMLYRVAPDMVSEALASEMGEPVPETPDKATASASLTTGQQTRRKRRTKAEIEADKARESAPTPGAEAQPMNQTPAFDAPPAQAPAAAPATPSSEGGNVVPFNPFAPK